MCVRSVRRKELAALFAGRFSTSGGEGVLW